MYVRPRQKKTLNEIYGSKLDYTAGAQNKKSAIRVQRQYTTPAFLNTFQGIEGQTACAKDAGNVTYRRGAPIRTRRGGEPNNRNTKPKDKDEKLGNIMNVEKDHPKLSTQRVEKNQSYLANAYENSEYFDTFENFVKAQTASVQLAQQQQQQQQQPQQQQHQHQQHQHHHHQHQHCQHQKEGKRPGYDEDRDEDTEEFVALIQHTVENAIGKSVSDLLNRNFRDITTKIDNYSEELKATQKLILKFQSELTKKIVHYGEENARHFRYLCMKSEYDKMFYQHQAMVSNTNSNKIPFPPMPTISTMPTMPTMPTMSTLPTATQLAQLSQMMQMMPMQQAPPETYRANDNQVNAEGAGGDNGNGPCTCRGTRSGVQMQTPHFSQQQHGGLHKCPSGEFHKKATNGAGDVGMREMIDQLQRFCVQFQANEGHGSAAGASCNATTSNGANAGNNTASRQHGGAVGGGGNYSRQNTYRPEDAIMTNKQAFLVDDDDDDDCLSTDAMSVNSMDQMQKYEQQAKILTSQRAKVTYAAVTAAAGGGDAQYA